MVSRQDQETGFSTVRPKILVLSIDFDGCIFHQRYSETQAQERLIETNEIFIQHVLDEINEGNFDKIIFMVGSNRQAKQYDDAGMRYGNTESCYAALIKLCDAIQTKTQVKCEVDRILLSDIYGKKQIGDNFTHAISGADYDFSDFTHQEHKYSLIYSQIHRVASEKPGADIFYHFYDDRDDILTHLLRAYTDNKDLIPHNLKLFTYQYNGEELKKYILKVDGFERLTHHFH